MAEALFLKAYNLLDFAQLYSSNRSYCTQPLSTGKLYVGFDTGIHV